MTPRAMRRRLSWLALFALTLASACDDRRPPEKHHPGTPMKLRPEDGPFTKARLIEVARYYYPAMEYAESNAPSSAELTRIEQSTPEWKAREAAHTQAMDNQGPWRDLVRSLEQALPDYYVANRTPWYKLEPAYVVHLVPLDESRKGMLIGMVSAVAPLYFICETTGERTMRHPIDAEFAGAAETLEREILARYPYHRLDHETGLTIVPELRAGNLWYRESTLIDLLLSTNW